VVGDEIKVRQILLNLLSNAFKFTHRGRITVRSNIPENDDDADETSRIVCFEVEDTGEGIAPDEMDLLFEPFVQTCAGRRSQGGTGLGLAISRSFIQMMGGDIQVRSRPGAGSVFSFHIRLAIPEAGKTWAMDHDSGQVTGLMPDQPEWKILVADPLPENRRLVTGLLKPLGFNVREAADGQEAENIRYAWEPHLVWLDTRIDGADTRKIVQRIRRMEKDEKERPRTTLVGMSSDLTEDNRDMILSDGYDDLLYRPFHSSELFDLLQQHLNVRYIYENASEIHGDKHAVSGREIRAGLGQLPPDILDAMEDAVTHLDMERIDHVIEQVSRTRTALAEGLTRLADNFEYDEILDLIRKAQNP